ncbi:MAG: acyl-CoA desaturase [Gloeocapsa sp. DLM2.Bin57]|nr:MAG: acyl-CoA desaturase [Gloeocapsa sp. DLM2.Bin57]
MTLHFASTQKQQYSLPVLIGYWLGPVFIIICHLGAIIPIFTGLSLGAWLWVFFLYLIRMLAITACYHRLLTHKAYKTPAWVKWIGCLIASSAGQMGPSWWKGHHEDHHNYVDQVGDPHSSVQGFIWSHMGWLLSNNFIPSKLPADVEQDPVLKIMDRLHFLPLLGLGLISFMIGGLEYLGAFFLSTTILFHGVALVNSVCHKFGSTPFKTDDYSKNNWWVAVLTLGEGWHNLHHALPWSANQGITVKDGQIKYLFDPTYQFIRLLQVMGIASALKLPSSEKVLENI